MGLLLRERIIFLGNEIEDFLADAIVSQLLLLDAMDSESDIRLFVNSPGGSLRYPPTHNPLPLVHASTL
jgi:ATP-dependent Clp protease protease subunit